MKLFWVSFLIVLTIGRNAVWQRQETLWKATTETSPNKPRAHMALGIIYAASQRNDLAMAEYQAAFRTADDTEPFHYQSAALSNMGKIFLDAGDHTKSAPFFTKALIMNPKSEQAATNLAVVFLRTGNPRMAMRILDQAAVDHPGAGGILFNQSEAMRLMGRCEEAL